ncbi:MAG: transposase [Symploca sp. SIO1A3]|nr:transposase [Symploca sp. SIO1A3]
MTYQPDKHHRRSIRLKGYDYTQAGAYFVTICTWQHQCLLGEVVDGEMQLNDYGKIAQFHWHNLLQHHQHLELDEFMIMPNHLHGILILTEDNTGKKRHGLSEIIRGFKTFAARRINKIRHLAGVSVWQRGYYEHIIRHERALMAIRQYIANNPLSWEKDELGSKNSQEWDGRIQDLGLQMKRM